MNGSEMYIAQKKFFVKWIREKFHIKKEKIIQKKEAGRDKKIELFRAKDALTAANILSYSRVVLAFFIIISLSNYNNILIINIFTFGIITDWLDGILAKALHQETEIGKIIDPTADKILIIGVLWNYKFDITWPFINTTWYLQPIIILFYIEFFLMITAFVKPLINKKFDLNLKTGANIYGKGKMILESIFVYIVLLFNTANLIFQTICQILIIIILFLAIMSLKGHWSIKK